MESQQNYNWKKQLFQKWDQQCSQIHNENQKKIKLPKTNSADDKQNTFHEIIHKIKPQDTLQGISIKYHVPVQQIKWRNNLSSTQIYFKHQIIVPNPQFISTPSLSQQRQDKINRVLKNINLDLQNKDLAVTLLNQTYWNVKNAIIKYYKDIEWQNKYADTISNFDKKKCSKQIFNHQSINNA